MREVLEGAKAAEDEDWALAWTVEELESERVEVEKAGLRHRAEVFLARPRRGRGQRATSITWSLILPERPYQVLAEGPRRVPGLKKYVVGREGRVLVYG